MIRDDLKILAVFAVVATIDKLAEEFLALAERLDDGARPSALLLYVACLSASGSLKNAIKVLETESAK